ncbi:MAG: hypothetical protein WCW53_09160 [Syntrophales bacterium]|jgi:hypothetical protein
MKASTHVGISAVAAISAYKLTGSQPMSISLFLSGIFIDLDHVLDFILLSKERFSISNFFSWCNDLRWQKAFIVFHSYELITIFALMSFLLANDILIGITIGCVLHLLADQISIMTLERTEGVSPWLYFFSYRYSVGFEKKGYFSKRVEPSLH